MLPAFHIRNYRLFKELDIPDLKRVNLIIGQNNVGKSTLLEALMTYIYRDNFLFYIFRSLADRNEWKYPDFSMQAMYKSFPLIFYKRQLYLDNKNKGIYLGKSLNQGLFFYLNNHRENYLVERVPNAITPRITPLSKIVIEKNNESLLEVDIMNVEQAYIPPLDYSKCLYVLAPNSRVKNTGQLAFLWEKIALTEKENYLIQALQLIDPNIERLTFIDRSNNGAKKAIVKLKNYPDPVSLASMGDGLNQLLKIVLALVNCENGYCLIDEIETGLHWSVQPNLWKMIFFLAEKLNIQVFATTHSRDCLWALQKAAISEKYADHTQVIKLKAFPKTERIKAITMDINQLSTAIHGDIEIR